MSWFIRRLAAGLTVALATTVLAMPTPAAPADGRAVLSVVAAENFWGSLAEQLGGRQVQVTSIVTDPNADPHEYETNPADARLLSLIHI